MTTYNPKIEEQTPPFTIKSKKTIEHNKVSAEPAKRKNQPITQPLLSGYTRRGSKLKRWKTVSFV